MFNEAIIMLLVNPKATMHVIRATRKADWYFCFFILLIMLIKNSEVAMQKTGCIPMRLMMFVKPIR
jgi:hypothetical protein